MSIAINILYKGKDNSARLFAEEMERDGIADKIREEEGCERYEYFFPMRDGSSVLLVDIWKDQAALDRHHKTEMMREIARLREKYDLHMSVERYISDEPDETGSKFIRR